MVEKGDEMSDEKHTPAAVDAAPAAIDAARAPVRGKASNYPPEFARRMAGRTKRALGDLFGLQGFGVNLTELAPGAQTALLHRHAVQDEFVYVLAGSPTLVTEDDAQPLAPGMCVGFRAGGGAHAIVNRSDAPATILEVGDRRVGDSVSYPADDLAAAKVDGAWRFTRKDGTPY